MKDNCIKKIKQSSLFLRGDLWIYFFVLIIVIGLLFAPLLSNDTANFSGFLVRVNNQDAITFSNGELTVLKEFVPLTETTEQEDGVSVKLYTHDKKGYNVIFFNTKNKTVKITESTCSASKDCVHFPAIKDKGTIYCAPHQVKITLIKGDGFTPPVAGGI